MLSIFHTNDFHNALTPQKAARLRTLKSERPNSLLLDAGDAIWAGNIYVRPFGEPVLRFMSEAGYDAMAVGNREFHFSRSGFRKKIAWARFPVLCANVRARKPGAPLPVTPWVEKTVAGVRVAIFGLTIPMITERSLSARVSSYVFDDPIEVAAKLAPELRDGHDVVIALTHIGLRQDRRLAAEVAGIDVIVGGHTHARLETPEMVGSTAIVQAGCRARHVGRVEILTDGNEVKVSAGIMEL